MQQFGSILSICLSVLIVGCEKQAEAERPAQGAMTVSVTPVTVQPVQRTVEVTGTLFGTEDATISAKVAGRIVAINKDIGDRVAPVKRWRRSTRPITS